METELGEERQNFLESAPHSAPMNSMPEPKPPLAVALDGAYVHAAGNEERKERWFEVVVGKSITAANEGKYLGFVLNYDEKPKRRLYESLRSQGLELGQPVTFFSDGEDTLRQLQMYVSPLSEHILDWFHIAMRVEQLSQTARGFCGTYDSPMNKEKILKELERVKWFLWHGNEFRADETLTDLMFEVDGAIEDREARRPAHLVLKKLARALEEFGTYIDNNASGIVNYGERQRCGERISTGFVESTINQLVAKRLVKKQQMRWTPRGAHLLLQIRVQTLNDDLHTAFERWYPELGRPCEEILAA
jgi:hypothetical protein